MEIIRLVAACAITAIVTALILMPRVVARRARKLEARIRELEDAVLSEREQAAKDREEHRRQLLRIVDVLKGQIRQIIDLRKIVRQFVAAGSRRNDS